MKKKKSDIQELLEEWSVHFPGMWENEASKHDSIIREWYAVSNNTGIIAYFQIEVDAFRFRLDQINRILNP